MNKYTFERAQSWVGAAERIVSNDDFHAHAGGIDNIDLIKEGILPVNGLISLASLRSKRPVSEKKGKGIFLDSMLSLSEISRHPVLLKKATALSMAAGKAATPNIRNVATLGGNLCQQPRCDYFRNALLSCPRRGADHCPAIEGDHENLAVFENAFCAAVLPSSLAIALSALGGQVQLINHENKRRIVPVEQIYRSGLEPEKTHLALDRGELIERVILRQDSSLRSYYLKVKPRVSFDWPIVETAAALSLDNNQRVKDVRVVIGGVALLPWRATLTEVELKGKVLSKEACKEAAKKASHGATPLRDNEYKTHIIERTVERVLCALIPEGEDKNHVE